MASGGKGKAPGAWQRSTAYATFVQKLVQARKSAGMTQRDVAGMLGKPPSWIARIESKERRLDVVEFIAIARALEMREAELLRAIAADLPKRIEV